MTELSTTAPDLAPAAVKALVRRVYGIEGSTRPLAGERDQNCLVEAADGSRYVLKISNPSESPAIVDFQIAALDHIARTSPAQPVPRVVRTLTGHTHDTVALAGGVQTRVRMLSYLDGIQIRETVRTAAQRRAMGAGLAGQWPGGTLDAVEAADHGLHGRRREVGRGGAQFGHRPSRPGSWRTSVKRLTP